VKDSDGHDAVWWARECREDLGLGQINYLVKSNEKWAADNLAGFPKSRAEDLDRVNSQASGAVRRSQQGTCWEAPHPAASCSTQSRPATAPPARSQLLPLSSGASPVRAGDSAAGGIIAARCSDCPQSMSVQSTSGRRPPSARTLCFASCCADGEDVEAVCVETIVLRPEMDGRTALSFAA
jgi:hypothetical protein